MEIHAYLNFEGRCEEAVEFYRKTLGAEVLSLSRFKDIPAQPGAPSMVPPGCENKVMHASFRIGKTTIMASDSHCTGKSNFQGFSLSLTVANEGEADKRFAALAEGGKVLMPMGKTFFAKRFGIVVDRFGVSWMVYLGA